MRKLIHSKFELDLSQFKLSDTEENNWFSDSFFAKYSFPFEIDLTAEWDVAFDFISLYNTNPETYYEVKYFDNNKIEDAVFVVESVKEKISCVLRFGLEQFPNWDTNLSDLPLEQFYLPTDTTIYQHAETIVSQTWPDVNYNFPQVHKDFDASDINWRKFNGIINNRVSSVFLTNSTEPDEDDPEFILPVNRNIIQPLPYLLYLLQQGFAQEGYTLDGNITNDDLLKKSTVYKFGEYFTRKNYEQFDFIVKNHDQSEKEFVSNGNTVGFYESKVSLNNKGRYRISNFIRLENTNPPSNVYFKIKYRGNVMYSYTLPNNKTEEIKSINVVVETVDDFLQDELVFESYQKINLVDGLYIYRLAVEYIGSSQTDSYLPASIINESKIDLTKAVPNITFGNLISVIKNWFNYDLTIEGNNAIMNKIEGEINYDDALDFQFTEIKKPYRKFNQNLSFLLKFADIDNKIYSFLPVFQDAKGVVNSGYKTNDDTKTIEIDALPLPLALKNNVTTAYALEDNDAKLFLVAYDGLTAGSNLAQSNEPYLLPSVHSNYWQKWFDFRIQSRGFNWSFTAFNESIEKLKTKTKIYAYKRFHIIKTINRTEIKPNLFKVDLETDTLP